jgi:phosphonate dehydrogenase
MFDVVTTHRIFPETLAQLQRGGAVATPQGERFTPDELRSTLAAARGVMTFMPDRVDHGFLDAAPRLAIVAGALKGWDNFDVEVCTRRGIWVSIVPDLLTAPTAELAVGLMIGLARHMRDADSYVRSGDFAGWTPRFYGLGLGDSTVGLVGMGAIGRAVATRLRGFGCRMLYHDEQELPAAMAGELAVSRCALDDLLGRSDIVVLCLPLVASTIHLIDERRLALLKPGALLVNPARGSLVDEASVARALTSGRLGGYAADTFELEDHSRADRPRSIPAELLRHPRTLLTPHIGSATMAARRTIEACAAANILDVLAGRAPRDAINSVAATRDGSGTCRAAI